MSLLSYVDTAMILFIIAVIIGAIAILKLNSNKTRRISNLRLYIQIAAVIGIFLGLIIGPFNGPDSVWRPLGVSPRSNLLGVDALGSQFPDGITAPILACYIPNGRTVTCAIWQIQSYIFPFWNYSRGYDVFYALTGLEMLLIVFSSLIAASLLLGRSFCGWLCPFGLYQDLLTRLRRLFKKRHLTLSKKKIDQLSQSRWIIIAVIILASVVLGSYALFGFEIIPGTALDTGHDALHSGIVSYVNEPYCLVCPERPLCILVQCAVGSMEWSYVSQIAYGPFYIAGWYVTSINLAVLIAVSLLAFAYRRFWCRICPMGALTALFSSHRPFNRVALTKLDKDREKCTKCGVCKRVCPMDVSEVYERKGGDVTASNCTLCLRCVEMCPYKDALKVKFAGKTVAASKDWLSEKG
ncbi:4Fe-4S binding protein [Candidatus Bathyarchaeota archaeon]|nr:4Fe-4S binding protein [Candidatus Bathyarchaeota archaeon]